MAIQEWNNPSVLSRIDTGRDDGGLNAVIYPPDAAHADKAAGLKEYLEQQGLTVYDDRLKEPDRDVLEITGFASEQDARYSETRLARVGFVAKYDPATRSLHVEGTNAKPKLGAVYREFEQQGYDVAASLRPGKETPVLRVRGFASEPALFSALAQQGYVAGPAPIDRMAGKSPLEKLRLKFLENPKRYSGVSNLLAAVINITSGILRGNFGEAAMGAGFAISNVNLTIGPRAPVDSEEVFNRVKRDFTVGEGAYDFTKHSGFTVGRGGYGSAVDGLLNFREDYATEIAGMFNVVSGSMAARGGYIDGKKRTVLEGDAKYPTQIKDKLAQAGKDVTSLDGWQTVATGVRGRSGLVRDGIPDVALDAKTGRPTVEKQWDTPYTFSGPLLVLGYLPALLVPPRGTDTKPLVDYERMGAGIRRIPLLGPVVGGIWDSAAMGAVKRSFVGKFFDKIIDQPRKWAGTLGVIHSGQQILFALREGIFTNPVWLEGYKEKFSKETDGFLREKIATEPFTTILSGVDSPLVEREHPRRKGTAWQLSDEARAAYKASVAAYEADPAKGDEQTYRAALLLGTYDLEDVASKKEKSCYQKLIDLHEKKLGTEERVIPDEERTAYQKALNRRNYDEMHGRRNLFVRRLSAFSLLFIGNFLFSRIDAKRGEVLTNAAESALDRTDVYARAANFVKEQSPEQQEQAREKFALALSLQPEFAGISKEQIAEDIAAKMQGRASSLEVAARAIPSPWNAERPVADVAAAPATAHADKVQRKTLDTLLNPAAAAPVASPSL
ncbi:MAG: hypothetical protein IT567_05350 [Alphaproteobacteria bacterium]|nr:hypothetical protein [Alphaproteobacteria bacterium]